MQRSWVTRRERAGAIVLVVAVHAALLAALLTLAPRNLLPESLAAPLKVFDVLPPKPPPPPPPPQAESRKAPKPEGASAPPARKANASEIKRPEPKVVLPVPPPTTTAPTPATGTAPAAGNAPTPGPGTGSGGTGSGTGSGGSGSGPGGGGDGIGQRPALLSRPLTQRDYSREARRDWPSGRRVLVIFNVQVDGRATDCSVYQSVGNPAIDAETCALVTSRLRFRPATDRSGKPIVARYAYAQVALF
jgi:protein TonB